ncbi:MAG: efflux RND transporter periplasmic adaptor subunit [Acidobacteriia bacterium]|nr:efflux RND transporter periplasmic adaptor subunit [Terriglobia bacterium]
MSFANYVPLAALAFLGACGTRPESPAIQQPPPIRVSAVSAEIRRLPSERVIPGTVTARTTTAVSARLPGHIREIRVREGDSVQSGQVIAVIDSRDAESAIRQAEAGRDEARAALPEAEAAIASATAQAELAKATFRRMEDLRNSKSITEQEFDEVQARLRLAESQVRMAQARLRQTRERMRQSEEAVSRAQLQQTYATVTAPYAGLVIERKAEPGTFASPGMPVVLLEKAGDYRLEVPVEESLLRGLKPGRLVTVELDTTAQLPISEILPSINPQSRTATIRINLPARPGLRTGMSGRMRLSGEERDAITVPANAIRANGQLHFVFVVANDRARATLISLGDAREGRVEILSGLDGKERIVVLPPPALTDGAPIETAQ